MKRPSAPPRPRSIAPGPLADRPGRGRIAWRRARRLLPSALAVVALLSVAAFVITELRAAHMDGLFAPVRERISALLDLRVKTVLIEGGQNTPEPRVRAILGVKPGDSLFGFSVSEARARVQTLSWIQNAAIERRLPDTVVVHLTERRPFAIWQFQKKFVLIDRNGDEVTDQQVTAFANLPLVSGADAPAHAAEMIDLIAKYPPVQSHIAAIARIGERRWDLLLRNGTVVMLPEQHEREALARLVELQASNELLDRPLAAVDLRLPDKMVIRQRTELPKDPAVPAKKST